MRRTSDFIKVTNMKVFAYHGVLEEEKKNGQDFYLNAKVYVDMRKAGLTDELEDTINYDKVCIFLAEVFAEKVFDTIEAAAEYTVQEIIVNFPTIEAMELEVRKPHAPLTYVPEDISVTIYREWHTVYLSFGSNMGNPTGHINEAITMLKDPYAIRNVKISELFVTKPYGPVEQNDFVNGCLEMETYMDPEELVTYIHEIEDYFERDRSVRWGPRPIDMDIVFFDDYIYNSKTLTIPHADMENRMFVLEPLSQLCPGRRHPVWGKTVAQLKKELLACGREEDILRKLEG
ncbi:MAG: 2-amino-4-hydroxy-6-hydroxymethyldihydropteridine diphosphokinase [Agathobacter sp.]|nr:2-amino-4-hydroxy-6-hydroxymethyldihydropteridine diphosphokinase [Agathobacter sp.]